MQAETCITATARDRRRKIMSNSNEYFQYLQTRTLWGKLYRNYFLYPKLNKFLRGNALDVGCGIGDFLKFRPNTIGVDINKSAVQWCISQGLEAYDMPINILPFSDASFDSAVIDNVIEHINDPKKLLEEIHRILKKQGRLIVGVPGKYGYTTDPDHKVYYDSESLLKTLKSAQFGSKAMFSMPFNSNWLNENARQYCIYGVFERE